MASQALPLAHFQHCVLLDDAVKQLYLTWKRSFNTSSEITLQLVIGAPSLLKQNKTFTGYIQERGMSV